VKSEQEAQDIQAQLKKGANFDELAKKHSVDSAGRRVVIWGGSAKAP